MEPPEDVQCAPPSPLNALPQDYLCSLQKYLLFLLSIPNSLYTSWGPRDEEGVELLFSKHSQSNWKSKTREKINKNLR